MRCPVISGTPRFLVAGANVTMSKLHAASSRRDAVVDGKMEPMRSPNANVRPARPQREDGELFARYLDLAGDGLFRWMLGPRSTAILARAFLSTGHDLSYEHTSFAESDGEVLGMVSGYTAAQHAISTDSTIEKAAGIYRLRLWATGVVAAPVLEFMDRLSDGDWYLQAVAVDPAHQGAGLGSMLFNHAEQVAQGTGSRRIVLDVAVDNHGARRFYEGRGMAVEATSPSIPLAPQSAVHRMVASLAEPER